MKYCSKCGYSNEDAATFCASCGESLTSNAQQSATNTYYAPPAYTANAASDPAAAKGKSSATLWLVLNIVATVLCCGNLLTIVGIIFAAIGIGSYNKGDIEDGENKIKIAKIMFFVGIGVAVVLFIICLLAGLLPFIFLGLSGGYNY